MRPESLGAIFAEFLAIFILCWIFSGLSLHDFLRMLAS